MLSSSVHFWLLATLAVALPQTGSSTYDPSLPAGKCTLRITGEAPATAKAPWENLSLELLDNNWGATFGEETKWKGTLGTLGTLTTLNQTSWLFAKEPGNDKSLWSIATKNVAVQSASGETPDLAISIWEGDSWYWSQCAIRTDGGVAKYRDCTFDCPA